MRGTCDVDVVGWGKAGAASQLERMVAEMTFADCNRADTWPPLGH